MAPLALGLMSGTSCDGISAVLGEFRGRSCRSVAFRTFPYPRAVIEQLRRGPSLSTPELSMLNIALGERLAEAARSLIRIARLSPSRRIAVIGSHGHTIYHGALDSIRSTLQIGEPAVIAHRTGIPVAANFRMGDIAAGGEGAPLVPFFDQHVFGHGPIRAFQNLGGIANVTVVGRDIAPIAFDTGPGNCLIDLAVRRITRERQSFDRNGQLARRGSIDPSMVRKLAAHPYFRKPPPKSTGTELFNETFLRETLGRSWARRGTDLIATLTYATAKTIAMSYQRFIPYRLREVVVSGGGVFNATLMDHLRALLSPVPVRSIEEFGIPAQAKEPMVFALLALRALRRLPNHLPATTGAGKPQILGSLVYSSR